MLRRLRIRSGPGVPGHSFFLQCLVMFIVFSPGFCCSFFHRPLARSPVKGDVPVFVVLAASVGVLTSLHTRAMWCFAAARRGV